MTLQSSEQNKKFVADGTSINKRASVEPLRSKEIQLPKSFLAIGEFLARPFTLIPTAANVARTEVSSDQSVANSQSAYANRTARVSVMSRNRIKIPSRAYARTGHF
jgi:hypothetical protein